MCCIVCCERKNLFQEILMPSNRTSIALVFLSAVLAFVATSSLAQQAVGEKDLSSGDRKFLTDAMQGDMAEIQLAQLALQKTSNPDVKQFAQKMVDDHTKMDEQIKPIADQLGVPAPTELPAKVSTLMTKLQAVNGADFDKQYTRAMVSDHRDDDAEFKKEETSGKSQAVKDAATQGEPTIAEHLQLAEALEKKM